MQKLRIQAGSEEEIDKSMGKSIFFFLEEEQRYLGDPDQG